jgi:hypothetical protein
VDPACFHLRGHATCDRTDELCSTAATRHPRCGVPHDEFCDRAEARQWIGANAPKQFEAELSKSSLGRIKLQHGDIVEVGKAWQKKKSDGGWVCLEVVLKSPFQ